MGERTGRVPENLHPIHPAPHPVGSQVQREEGAAEGRARSPESWCCALSPTSHDKTTRTTAQALIKGLPRVRGHSKHFMWINSFNSLNDPTRPGTVVMCILQIKKLRHRMVESFVKPTAELGLEPCSQAAGSAPTQLS